MSLPSVDHSPIAHVVNHGVYTTGDYATEVESARGFDAAVERLPDCFRVYREVSGQLLQPRPDQEPGALRIDRVLTPQGRLLEAGWRGGALGVELKRSRTKIGPCLAQALDYSRTAWTLSNGVSVLLRWVFLWPLGRQSNAVGSVCAQHRLGGVQSSYWGSGLVFTSGENVVLEISRTGVIRIGPASTYGRRTGSR